MYFRMKRLSPIPRKAELTARQHALTSRERGASLIEMLVGVAIFSLVGVALMGISSRSLNDLGLESRATLETFELKRGLGLLAAELRMSSMLSPYLPGTNDAAARCAQSVSVSARTVSFLVAFDDGAAAGGMRPYYVGYRFDPATGQLLRGEIPAPGIFTCTLPAGDPTAAPYARPLAANVEELDSNGDGAAESAFAWSNGVLSVNLGSRVDGAGQVSKRQAFSTRAFGRIL